MRTVRQLLVLLVGVLSVRCGAVLYGGAIALTPLTPCINKSLDSGWVRLSEPYELRSIARTLRSRGYAVTEHMNVDIGSSLRLDVEKVSFSRSWIEIPTSSQFGVRARLALLGSQAYVEFRSDYVQCSVSNRDLLRPADALVKDMNLTGRQSAELKEHLRIRVKHEGFF